MATFNYRSTNGIGYTHFGGAMVVGTEVGSGIELNPASTGTAPNIMPAGDETNIGITLQSKGTGTITIGSSANQPLVIASTGVTMAGSIKLGSGSTTSVSLLQRYLVQWTVPALSSGASAESTVTVTGLTTNSILVFQPRVILNSTVVGVAATVRCSTANELVIINHNISESSLSGSTQSAYLLQFSF